MIISHSRSYIFFHTPKCAGSAVNQALYETGSRDEYFKIDGTVECSSGVHYKSEKLNQHSKPAAVYGNLNDCFPNYFKFATIRNPFSLEISKYNYAIESYKQMVLNCTGGDIDNKWFEYCENVNNSSFTEFISSDNNNDLTFCDRYVGKNGDLLVDYIIKVEELENKYNFVCKLLKIPNKLQRVRVNKSKITKNIETLDTEQIKLIEEKYSDDLEFFNYSYNDLTQT